jgi:hypothetical protein
MEWVSLVTKSARHYRVAHAAVSVGNGQMSDTE